MIQNKIEDNETLYRVVRRSVPGVFDSNGKPTATLFMDNGGVSVDREGDRSSSEIVDSFKQRFKSDYVDAVCITAGDCKEAGTCPKPIGNTKNIYHAEIWESETQIRISLLKAMILASKCKIVE